MKFSVLVAVVLGLGWAVAAAQDATLAAPTGASVTPEEQAWAKMDADFQDLQMVRESDRDGIAEKATALAAEAKDFYTKYPKSPHATNAKLVWAQLGMKAISNNWKDAPSEADVMKAFDDVAADESIPKPKRAEIRMMQLGRQIQNATGNPDDAAKWDAIDKKIAEFENTFGPDFAYDGQNMPVVQMRGVELEVLASAKKPDRFNALVKKLEASSQPQLVELAKDAATRAKRLADIKSKPLDLKFTSLDGLPVDISKLRGKVVLVDFWATWCGPCRDELPHLIDAYVKYHPTGFEIIGISLDGDKQLLDSYVKIHHITWPQYFDGKTWDNEISKSFGIDSIPAMWLVGKDGMVITTDAREGLDDRIAKALAD